MEGSVMGVPIGVHVAHTGNYCCACTVKGSQSAQMRSSRLQKHHHWCATMCIGVHGVSLHTVQL